MLELRAVRYADPDVAVLVAAVQREYVLRYGGEDAEPVDPAEFAPPRGRFVVGYALGVPVACGGWRAREGGGTRTPGWVDARPARTTGPSRADAACGACGDADTALRDGDAEVKRMFVVAAHRRLGYARAVLAELERTAATAGRRRMVLETGTAQPEAIALYTSAGYRPIPGFGYYRDAPRSRCFAKELPGAHT